MRSIALILGVIISQLLPADETLFDLKAKGYEQYQDAYVKGEVVEKASYAERFLDRRFEIVDQILSRYERPFTMLDIGAAQGYFSFRAAEQYPDSVFVMLEGSNPIYPMISKQLESLCHLNDHLNNVVWLNRMIVPDEVVKMGIAEHFDVILALHILHWFPQEWKKMVAAFRKMSHVTIYEVPPIEKGLTAEQKKLRKEIHNHLKEIATEVIQGVPRHNDLSLYTTYYIVENSSPYCLERTTLVHPYYGDRHHFVHFDYHSKKLLKRESAPPHEESDCEWHPGINLFTYLLFDGAYPTRKHIQDHLPIDRAHKDWQPNNMILQGSDLVLIDHDDPKNKRFEAIYSKRREEAIKKFVSHDYHMDQKLMWQILQRDLASF